MAFRTAISLFALAFLFAPALRADEPEPKADLKKLEATITKALKAYNEGDHKKFFAEYAKSMQALANEQTFKALYTDGYMKAFGKFQEKPGLKFLEKKSVLTGEILAVMWAAEFEKNKKAMVAVNFQKEGDNYRLMQIQIHELPKDDQ